MRPRPTLLEFSAIFEIYPEVKVGDLSDVTIERPQARRRSRGHRADRSRCCAGSARATNPLRAAPRPRAIASIVDFTRQDGRRRVSRRAGERLRDRSRRGPDAAGVRSGRLRDERGRDARRSRSRFPADYHGKEVAGKEAEFTLTVKRVERVSCPKSTPSSRAPSALRAAASTSSRPRSHRTCSSSSKRKIEAKVKEQVFAALREKAAVRGAEIARRKRDAEHGATNGGARCASRA